MSISQLDETPIPLFSPYVLLPEIFMSKGRSLAESAINEILTRVGFTQLQCTPGSRYNENSDPIGGIRPLPNSCR